MIYSNEIKQKAKELYLSGMTYKQVSKELNIKYKTLANWGEKEKYGRGTQKYTDELRNTIIAEYESGIDSVMLSKKYNIDDCTIQYWIRKYSYPRHRGPKSMIGNENFFDNIDSEEKAYILGYLMADGNVSCHNGQYSLKIHINIIDKEFIDFFLKAIESTNKATEKTGNKYYTSVTSVHMVKTLYKYGIIPNKTGKEIIPDIDDKLINHFVRGFFDGDGITDIVQKRSGFVSGGPIIYTLHEMLNATSKICTRQVGKGMEYYYFLGAKQFNLNLYKYMYSNATIWLTRKRNRMDIICGNTEVTSISNKMLEP